MPDPSNLVKAELRQLDSTFTDEIHPDKWCIVQFNPESLKVSFANQLNQPAGVGGQTGSATRQFVGSNTTKLSLTLWFDVGSPQSQKDRVNDVRLLTEKVAYFVHGAKQGEAFVPPAVRFVWGSFQFDGLMDSMEETLEYFSADGRPLRASVAVSLSRQDYQFGFSDEKYRGQWRNSVATPGSKELARAAAGSCVQALADAAGLGGDWQSIAAANGIENPRAPGAGTMLDMDLRARTLGGDRGLEVAPAAGRGR